MQIRRVLLLFALVLGLSAVVASVAPSPEESRDEQATRGNAGAPAVSTGPAVRIAPVRLRARANGSPRVVQRVPAGSSFTLIVSVREPGDVVIDDLGMRQTADPHSPARFELLASPPGRHYVGFEPLLGERRVIGQLAFVEAETVTRRPHGR